MSFLYGVARLLISLPTRITHLLRTIPFNYFRINFCLFLLIVNRINLIHFFQVLSTLHEYPCLETCIGLLHYISACVRIAWKMANHTIPYYLDQDFALGECCQSCPRNKGPIYSSHRNPFRRFTSTG